MKKRIMSVLKVQLNHPGRQKRFVLGNGYQLIGGRVVREWNDDETHYRKFLYHNGIYLDSICDKIPKKSKLFFWGEWEGNSFFQQLTNPDSIILPNGIHEPFHSIAPRGRQNTDPYVFGNYFKYATCKQTGKLCYLCAGSLILFGTTYPSLNIFYIDTVFVIKTHESAIDVCANVATNYTHIYKEETLEQLSQEYIDHPPSNTKKLYHSQSWWDNNKYFSFVPCKLGHNGDGFERLKINLNNRFLNLSSNPQATSYFPHCDFDPEEIWNLIVKMTLKQGFSLGIRFNEPTSFNLSLGYANRQTLCAINKERYHSDKLK